MRDRVRFAVTRRRDGRVSKIVPNARSPVSKGAFCVKGIRGALRNGPTRPDRLIHPMRRIGERGSGQWERIGWDEALDEMADRTGGSSRADMVRRRWSAR